MLLQETFEKWAKEEGGKWASSSRPIMQRVFFRTHAFVPLKRFNREYVKEFFSKSQSYIADKVKAASALVAVLKYAHRLDETIPEPDFDYTISSPEKPKPVKKRFVIPIVRVPVIVEEPRPVRHYTRSVVQLDRKTLKPVATFPSVSDAMISTHTTDMSRALKEHCLANGYYWCYKESLEDFKPKEKRKPGPSSKRN